MDTPDTTTVPDPSGDPQVGRLEAHLCRVGGLNHNYTSSAGMPYHVQVEDRGPLLDRLTESAVRRVNVVIYANYGEANARVVHSHDHDLPDVRTAEHNRLVQRRIQDVAVEARGIIEEKEQRQVMRIKCLIREYYFTKDEAAKREFEQANALYPFLFSRAWRELREERQRSGAASAAVSVAVAQVLPERAREDGVEVAAEEIAYPLEAELRELVLEIERMIIELGRDLQTLRQRGEADDILLQTCRKLARRAQESISRQKPGELNVRRLEMTRNSLMTTWRQVRSRLRLPD